MFCHAMEVRAQPLSILLAHIVRDMRAGLSNQHVFLKAGNGLILKELYPRSYASVEADKTSKIISGLTSTSGLACPQ